MHTPNKGGGGKQWERARQNAAGTKMSKKCTHTSHCQAMPEERPVEYDVHNFNAILKLIWKFTQAIELNESFIVYLVLRFTCVFFFISPILSFFRFIFRVFRISLHLFVANEHCLPHCSHASRTWAEKNKNELLAFYIPMYEWNDSISTAHVAHDKTNMG